MVFRTDIVEMFRIMFLTNALLWIEYLCLFIGSEYYK